MAKLPGSSWFLVLFFFLWSIFDYCTVMISCDMYTKHNPLRTCTIWGEILIQSIISLNPFIVAFFPRFLGNDYPVFIETIPTNQPSRSKRKASRALTKKNISTRAWPPARGSCKYIPYILDFELACWLALLGSNKCSLVSRGSHRRHRQRPQRWRNRCRRHWLQGQEESQGPDAARGGHRGRHGVYHSRWARSASQKT